MMKKLAVLLILLFLPLSCFAQSLANNAPDIADTMTPLINFLMPIAGIAVFIGITVLFYRIATSGLSSQSYSTPQKKQNKQKKTIQEENITEDVTPLELESKQEEDPLLNTKISFPSSVKEVVK